VFKKFPEFAEDFTKFRLKFIKQDKDLGLDYLMNLPKKVNEKLMEDTESNLKRYIQKNGGNANYTQQDVKARLK
jgi:hypothetical protein